MVIADLPLARNFFHMILTFICILLNAMTDTQSSSALTKQLNLTADDNITPASGAVMRPTDTTKAGERAADTTAADTSLPSPTKTYDSNSRPAAQTAPEPHDFSNIPVSVGHAKFYLDDLDSMSQRGLVALLQSLGQNITVDTASSRMELFGSVVPLLHAADRIAH